MEGAAGIGDGMMEMGVSKNRGTPKRMFYNGKHC